WYESQSSPAPAVSSTSGSVTTMSPTTAIRVMVVDDDPMVITGIKGILRAAEDIDVVGSAMSGEEAIEKAALHYPEVVLMDIRMPGIGGIEAIGRLLNSVRPPRVGALTSMDSDDHLFRALEAGAAGYLLKDIGPVELAVAVRKAQAGEPILAPQSMRQMIAKVTSSPDHHLHRERKRCSPNSPSESWRSPSSWPRGCRIRRSRRGPS